MSTRRIAGALRALAALAAALALMPFAALAHPLGQNAYNREAALVVEPDAVRINYLLDLAEVPTLSVGQEADVDLDGVVSEAEWTGYAGRWAAALPQSLVVEVDGKPIALTLDNQTWSVAPGQAGLSTLRLLAHLHGALLQPLAAAGARLDYRDETHVNRLGWKEIWINAANGARIESTDVPREDRSKALTDFTPRAEGPPELIAAHATLAVAPVADTDINTSAATLATADIKVDARAGSEKAAVAEQSSPLWSFFKLGVKHIATGWDHLMFLLGLVLLSDNLRKLAVTVTAFTVAHSITLALAAFGLVNPPASWVEVLIALTIAYVGAVALTGRKNNHGPALAFGFGLVHGLGFAGALAESLGSNKALRLTGLISFNLGIEAFQLSLVCLVVPVLRSAARGRHHGTVYKMLASLVLIAGMQWFLVRTIGDGAAEQIGVVTLCFALVAFMVIRHRGERVPLMS